MNALLVRIAPFIFKPSLQHQNPDIRLLALERLDLTQAETLQHLQEWLQQEADEALLEQALQRLNDTHLLIQLLQTAAPEHLLPRLSQQLSQRLHEATEATLDAQLALLEPLTRKAALLALLQQTAPVEIGEALLDRLTADEEDWLALARDGNLARLRQQAAERIQHETTLERLMREAQSDKRVQRIARERLAALRAERQAAELAEQQRQQLLEQLQRLVQGADDKLFMARLDYLKQQWQTLQATATPHFQQTLAEWLAQAEQQAAILQQQERQQQQQEAEKQARLAQRQAILQELDILYLAARQQPAIDADALQQILAPLQHAWLNNQHDGASSTLPAQLTQLLQYTQALQSWQQLQQTLASQPLPETQLRQQLAALHWPAEFPLPPTIQHLRATLQARPAPPSTADTGKLNELLDLLQQHLEQGLTREALKLHQQLQPGVEQLPANHRLANRHRALQAQLGELRDWQGFVAVPKREALCEQMEALAAETGMNPQAKADRIQALQQEWRSLGAAAANRALWSRFKQAADLAYEPCKTWFAEQAQVREYNQQQRQIICEELAALVQSGRHLQLDESTLEQLLNQAHDEWHRFTPVNRAEGKQLATHFHQALQPINQQLHQLRQAHVERKRALIEAARTLLDAQDLQAATETSKQLQQAWREAGTAPGSLEHQLWKEFRNLCDQLFRQRDEQREIRRRDHQQHVQQARTALETAREALLAGQLEAATQHFRLAARLRNPPRQEQESWEAALTAFAMELEQAQLRASHQEANADLLQHLEQLPVNGQIQDAATAHQLLVELDLLTGHPVPAADQQLKLERQIERMNSGRGSLNPEQTRSEIKQLLQLWQNLGGGRNGPQGERLVAAIRHYCGAA